MSRTALEPSEDRKKIETIIFVKRVQVALNELNDIKVTVRKWPLFTAEPKYAALIEHISDTIHRVNLELTGTKGIIQGEQNDIYGHQYASLLNTYLRAYQDQYRDDPRANAIVNDLVSDVRLIFHLDRATSDTAASKP